MAEQKASEKESKIMHNIKVILLGEVGTGKTSLINIFRKGF